MKNNKTYLRKLKSELNAPVHYYLRFSAEEILLNNYLGKTISFRATGNIYCIQCERKTHKSFQQGFCFVCLRRLQECHLCVIHPERCQVETGQCPENDWAHEQCHQEHIVYLANTSGLKVGITRKTNLLTRWIDQGALQALPIFSTKNRYQAGMMEVALKAFVADRTNWRSMLQNKSPLIDLMIERDKLLAQAKEQIFAIINQFRSGEIETITLRENTLLHYPALEYPEKINPLSFEKTPSITGKLLAIKGQYLIFDHGVLNIRKYGGYEVECGMDLC